MQWRRDLEEGRCCRVRGSGSGSGVGVGACTCHVIECSGASGIAPHDGFSSVDCSVGWFVE